jgi:methylase of polypeptide subunit release factors
LLLLEHGNDQRAPIVELAAQADFAVVAAHADLAGHDRIVVLQSAR